MFYYKYTEEINSLTFSLENYIFIKMIEKKRYKMIQVSEESHSKLKEYCESNDKKMSKVIERLIDSHASIKKLPMNVLSSK
jgi:hypothetical protein